MSLVSVPSGIDVYNLVAKKGVTPGHFMNPLTGQPYALTDIDTIAVMVESDILPRVVSEANEEADQSAQPLDFPLDYATVKERYPQKSDAQIAEMIGSVNVPGWTGGVVVAYQDGRFYDFVLYLSASRLIDEVNSLNEAFATWSQQWQQRAYDELSKGTDKLKALVQGITAVRNDEVQLEMQTANVPIISVW